MFEIPDFFYLKWDFVRNMVLLFADINECDLQTDVCNNNGTGQICRNIVRSFVCECNRTMGFGLINGVCQGM